MRAARFHRLTSPITRPRSTSPTVADKGQVAISNSKVVSDTTGPGDKHTVRFATTPKMSSYLAALVVGNFEYIEGEADGIPIRIYSTPGKKEMGKFALESAEHVLSYYDKYFNIKYPYGKLDLIGMPDFSAGAMENTGCITFREVLLQVDEKQARSDLKKTVASVIAHEMAHQWFGDLVTMKWWDDIWLNEGFATWMSSKPIEAWKPEWNFNLDDVSGTGGTMNTDSLANTRPIHQAAETPAQIQELFDGIAYGKAASVLRMLEAYLGEADIPRGRQRLYPATSICQRDRRRLLGRAGEDLEEASRPNHAHVRKAGGRSDH